LFQPRIPANELRQTLDYAERICAANDWLSFHYGITDPRMVAGKLVDLGAPIADWRNDPRVFDVRLPDNLTRVPAKDMFGNQRGDWAGDVYVGPEAETLRGIRREYEKRLIDWFMADVPPVPLASDEAKVCHWLIQCMPSVEEFVDEGFPVMGAAA
jgi:hypothetical protein